MVSLAHCLPPLRRRGFAGRAHPARGTASPARTGLALLVGLLGALLFAAPGAWAHPGPLDEYGGHFDKRTGTYHYHRPHFDIARRKREYLQWLAYPLKGVIKGTVVRIDRPDRIWLEIPYRPAYQELSPSVAAGQRDDRKAQLMVWMHFVSPQGSVDRGAKYDDWFRQKVVYELRRKLMGKEVTVQFQILPKVGALWGMVFLGEENVNLWLVLNGWSYYVLDQGENPYDKLFTQAEGLARRNKVGLWAKAR